MRMWATGRDTASVASLKRKAVTEACVIALTVGGQVANEFQGVADMPEATAPAR